MQKCKTGKRCNFLISLLFYVCKSFLLLKNLKALYSIATYLINVQGGCVSSRRHGKLQRDGHVVIVGGFRRR